MQTLQQTNLGGLSCPKVYQVDYLTRETVLPLGMSRKMGCGNESSYHGLEKY